MELTTHDLVLLDRQTPTRLRKFEQLIRIRRGVYLPAALLNPHESPWVLARLVALARSLAPAAINANEPPALTLESALIIHDLPTWNRIPPVTYRTSSSNGTARTHLPEVPLSSIIIRASTERTSRAVATTTETVARRGGVTASLPQIAIDCARFLHPLAAVVATSGILRRLSEFDRRDLTASREGESAAKAHIAALLEQHPHLPHTHRARAVIDIASGGIESPGEAAILWILKTVLWNTASGGANVVVQQPVAVDGETFFGDACLVAERVIVEFDGYKKVTSRERHFVERQRKLTRAGWRIMRIELDQLRDINTLITYVIQELRSLGASAGYPKGPAWQEVPHDVAAQFFAY
jgi:very-short-patch-repair endonuclease